MEQVIKKLTKKIEALYEAEGFEPPAITEALVDAFVKAADEYGYETLDEVEDVFVFDVIDRAEQIAGVGA